MTAIKKPTLKAITIKRLEWIKAQLKAKPHSYNQGTFCGTQGCLAGYCLPVIVRDKTNPILDYFPGDEYGLSKVELGRFKFYTKDEPGFEMFNLPFRTAAKYLHLTAEQADRLFAGVWGGKAEKFNRKYGDTDEESANRAISRINLFIKTGGEV